MDIVTERRAGKIILGLKEERLDAHNSGELKERISKLFEEGSRGIIVDLHEVEFIDRRQHATAPRRESWRGR